MSGEQTVPNELCEECDEELDQHCDECGECNCPGAHCYLCGETTCDGDCENDEETETTKSDQETTKSD